MDFLKIILLEIVSQFIFEFKKIVIRGVLLQTNKFLYQQHQFHYFKSAA